MKFTDCIEIVGSKPTLYEGTKQYVSTGAVEEYFININSIEEYTYNERPSRADLVGKSGDILFAKMAETKKTLILDKETENYLFSTGFFAIRPKSGILTTKCLYYLLNSKNFLSQKDKNSSGATQKAITNSGLEKINVNIPLFSKQDHIVKQFDLLTDIIKKYQSQLEKLDLIIKSRFIEMFGDPLSNPKEWEKKELQELVTDDCTISYGIVQTGENQKEGIKVFRPIDIVNRKPVLSELIKTTEEISNKYKKTLLKGRELLITVRANIGDTCVIGSEFKGCNVGRGIVPIRTNERLITLEFLKNQFDTVEMNRYVKSLAKGITLIQLNMEDLRKINLIVPPLELQNEYTAFVQQIDKSKFAVQKSLEKAETLYKSLMQEYFG